MGSDAGGDEAVGDVEEAGEAFLAGEIFRDWGNIGWDGCTTESTGEDDRAGLEFDATVNMNFFGTPRASITSSSSVEYCERVFPVWSLLYCDQWLAHIP